MTRDGIVESAAQTLMSLDLTLPARRNPGRDPAVAQPSLAVAVFLAALVVVLAMVVLLSTRPAEAADLRPAAAAVAPAAPKTVVKRFALITGATKGGPGRVALRFAESDARAMRHVLSDLGGLGETETLLLLNVGRDGMRGGFDRLKRMVAAARAPGARTEMIFYYSGHSDETGLLLGDERVSYPEIRAWVEDTGADVRIAVLDSCASGALTREKGGVHRPPFLVDTSSAARGHAYLTASAENEAAQESDRIGAAYFTHYLVSGLRGAADVSHDGRVTLSEAYQYAFTETLARTETSRGGPQHASYDFQLAGKGDLVMTDLRATSASLVLPPELGGRVFVRDANGQLIAEVHKLQAQPIELGLPPGRYRVTLDDNRHLSEATIQLDAGKQTPLGPGMLVALAPTAATSRGAGEAEANPTLAAAAAPPPPRYKLNLSVFPPLDTNGGVASDNAFVFGIVARSAGFSGFSLTLGHQVLNDAKGVQIGELGNVVEGRTTGVQIAGLGNIDRGDVRGVVIGGLGSIGYADATGVRLGGLLDYVGGGVEGVQVAGLFTAADHGRGVGIGGGATFVRHDYTGLQLAGGFNYAGGEVRGTQIAGVLNLAQKLTGAQLAVVNVGGEVKGTQVGVVNVARKVKGAQVGVVNVADSVDGVSFGLVPWVRDGLHAMELSTTEVGATLVSGVLGTQHFYARLGLGVIGGGNDLPGGRDVLTGSNAASSHYLLAWGFGGHHVVNDRWFVDGEILGTQYYRNQRDVTASDLAVDLDQEDAVTGSVRLLVGLRLVKSLSLVFGPTYNVSVGWNQTDLVTGTDFAQSTIHSGQTTVRMYPGATLGVRI